MSSAPDDCNQSYAKEQLGLKSGETKMLGLPWDKTEDTIAATFPEPPPEVTKREMLRFLASIYDPLGVASPVSLVGKLVYREVCDQNQSWDKKVPEYIERKWKQFEKNLPDQLSVPRHVTDSQEAIDAIDFHAFGDTSGTGTAAAVYAVVHQASSSNQRLLVAKARLEKKGLTIPRLELVSAYMAANLSENVENALQGQPVKSVYGWLDSTVALHWIKGGGGSTYKQFVANRAQKIREKDFIEWRHVGTSQNPADIGSRGCDGDKLPRLWLKGPEWLADPERWPLHLLTEPTEETEAEAKLTEELFRTAVKTKNELDDILQKHNYWTTIRVTAWIRRLLDNCKLSKET